jgi:hypothetical protein
MEVRSWRNLKIRLEESFFWFCLYYYGTIMVGRIVIKCNCIAVRIGKCLCTVCPIVFGLKQKDSSSLFSFNYASVYAIREAAAKQEGLEFNSNRCVEGVGLIYSNHRIVLEATIA